MTPDELHQSPQHDLVLELDHDDMIPFVREQLDAGSAFMQRFIRFNWLFTLGTLFYAGWQLYHGWVGPGRMVLNFLLGVVISMTVLILVHEGLHALAYRWVGARRIQFGGSFRQMYFYAVADKQVLNKSQFTLVALAPFSVILLLSVLSIFWAAPVFEWVILGMVLVHNWNCVGDFAMLSYYQSFRGSQVYTYDDVTAGKSYFFKQQT